MGDSPPRYILQRPACRQRPDACRDRGTKERTSRMKHTLTVAFMASLAISAIGCSKSYPKADNPKQAAINMVQAMLDGNEKGLLACFTGLSTDQRKMLVGVCAFSHAGAKFRDKMIKVYGQGAWDTFQATAAGGARLTLPKLFSPEEFTVEIDGDSAVLMRLGDPDPMYLVRKDGLWLIDPSTIRTADASGEQTGQMMEKLAVIINKHTKMIGKRGMTAEKLDVELGKALFPVITGAQ